MDHPGNSKASRVYDAIVAIVQFIILDLNKIVLAIVLCIPTIGFAIAMPIHLWHESWDLISIARDPSATSAEFTIGVLGLMDEILLSGVFVLVVPGSMQIYIFDPEINKMTGSKRYRASAFKNLSSGTLKEKVISTIGIASALFLFKSMLELPTREINWLQFTVLGVFHMLFIIGYAVMSVCNKMHDSGSHAAGSASNHDVHDSKDATHHDPSAATAVDVALKEGHEHA